MSVFRNLPSVHPVHKILAPHLRTVMAVNTVYRKHLLPDNKALAEFLAIGQENGETKQFLLNCRVIVNFDLLSRSRARVLTSASDKLHVRFVQSSGEFCRTSSLR